MMAVFHGYDHLFAKKNWMESIIRKFYNPGHPKLTSRAMLLNTAT